VKLLNHVYNYLVVGPSGTGKTTFLSAYAEHHNNKFQTEGYWLTFPSIENILKEILPEWIHTTTDLIDPGFAGSSMNPTRKFVIGDEINRLISKYDHAKSMGKTFVDLVSIHRHKNFDLLVSDQVFDFLKGVRSRSHWIIFTGLNDTLYYALRDNLSPRLMFWLERYQGDLLSLGEENRETIPNGTGQVVVTNGIQSFLLPFKRPKWYTQELSTIWKMVSPADLKKENEEDSTSSNFDFESDHYHALCLAYHLSKKIFNGRITKEKITAAYVPSSVVIFGEAKKLSDNGRGIPELISAAHSLHCYWCEHKSEYKEILTQLNKQSMEPMEKDPEIKSLEDQVARTLGG